MKKRSDQLNKQNFKKSDHMKGRLAVDGPHEHGERHDGVDRGWLKFERSKVFWGEQGIRTSRFCVVKACL